MFGKDKASKDAEKKKAAMEAKTKEASEKVVAKEQKVNEALINQYVSQSKPTMMNMNYTAPTGKESTFEAKAHTGTPSCYSCCGVNCAITLIGIVAVMIVCCAYVSPKDQPCCSICYWPF